MAGLMSIDEAKDVTRKTLEGQPIGLNIEYDNDNKTVNVYPYVLLPIGNMLESIKAGAHGMVHVYRDLFQESGVTTAAFPEAKSWPFLHEFCRLTGLRFTAPNKKDVNMPGQLEFMCGTAYRGRSPMFDPYVTKEDMSILVIDDTISSGDTQEGCVEGYERSGRTVVGGISAYERGMGTDNLNKKYRPAGKEFAGFARMEIVPRGKYEKDLAEEFGTEDFDELSRRYSRHLYDKYFIRKDSAWHDILNDRFEVVVPYFYCD